MKKLTSFLIYPTYVFGSLGILFFLLPQYSESILQKFTLMGIISAIFFDLIFIHEYVRPYRKETKISRKERFTDSVQTLMIFPVLAIGTSLLLRFTIGSPLKNFWPHQWSVLLQLFLLLIIAEFFHYHYHRLSHRKKWLWKLHTIHHGPDKIYSLNSAKFHVFDMAFNMLVYAAPGVLLGVGDDVLLGFMLINSVTGTLEHANIIYHAGPMNRLFNTGQLHRWHHSQNRRDSQKNFGKVLSIWDQVYGSYYMPKRFEVFRFGMNKINLPLGLRGQFYFPFGGREQFRARVVRAIPMLLLLLLSMISRTSRASTEGLDLDLIRGQNLATKTRPCCNFGTNPVLDHVGLFQFADKENLGSHQYGEEKKDKYGLVYTCRGGFVDVAHLRDNADWTAQILSLFKDELGSGSTHEIRKEGGYLFRRIKFLKQDDVDTLSEEDQSKLAIAMTFSIATLHEITTGFDVPVSMPKTKIIYEKASSFSVEDQYSNLLGAYLGASAYFSSAPYNQAMTNILNDKLSELVAQDLSATKELYYSLEKKWWQKDLLGRSRAVKIRNFAFEGEVLPVRAELLACDGSSPLSLPIPSVLSNGKSVNDYFVLEGLIDSRFEKELKKAGISGRKVLTQEDFSSIMKILRPSLEKDLK